MIISEPVRHGRHEFTFEFRDVDCLWQGHHQASHVRDAASLRDFPIRTGQSRFGGARGAGGRVHGKGLSADRRSNVVG